MTYTASSSDSAVAYPEVVGDSLYVHTVAHGSVTITVSATDPGGLSATTAFDFTVLAPCSGFCVDLGFTDAVTEIQKDGIRAAVGAFEAILADTELPDVVLPEGFDCAGLVPDLREVDDYMFMVHVGPIDGPGGTLARAGYCARRSGRGLPIVSRAVFDAADMDQIIALGMLTDVAFHELAHGEITLAAFTDLGYVVDGTLASDHMLPGPPPPFPAKGRPRLIFDLSGDVEQGPVTIPGPDGHVARVIPPPPGYAPPRGTDRRVTVDVRSPRRPYPALRRPGVPPRRPR